MKYKVLSSLFALVLAVGVGCGDDGVNGGGGSGGGPSTGGNGGEDGEGGTPVISGGGGSGGETTGDGNDSFAEAIGLMDDGGVLIGEGDLDPADSDADYYSFTGVAGQAIYIGSDAKPDDDPYAEGYVDLVITVFDSAENQIAQNDDPFPRNTQDSSLYTILPADGTYYLKVEEFCAWASAGTCEPDYFDNLSDTIFVTYVIPLDGAENSNVPEATEPNDTQGTASVMEYEPTATAGQYYLSIAWGEYQTAGDVDGLLLAPPDDVTIDPGSRATASVVFPPPGPNGNGSSVNPGLITVTNLTTSQIVAQFDYGGRTEDVTARGSLDFPVDLAASYLVTNAEGPIATGPGAPFYFAIHGVNQGNPVETEPNDTVLLPETLDQAEGVLSYFVEGDLPPITDVADVFRVSVLDETFSVACGAARSGSGVEDFTVTVYGGDGITEIATATETDAEDLLIDSADVVGENELIVEITSGGQDPVVVTNYYRCGFHFNPAP